MKSSSKLETERCSSAPLPDRHPLQLLYGEHISAGEETKWALVVGPRSINATILTVIARLGEHGAVRVLDGGNRFNAYIVARAARGRPDVLNRITVSRAFTCYQVLSLLESTPAVQAPTVPAPLVPTGCSASVKTADSLKTTTGTHDSLWPHRLVLLDMLNTFYDESVQIGERKRLLRACIVHLKRLAEAAEGSLWLPRLVTIHPPAVASQAAVDLLSMLQASATVETIFLQPEAAAPEPLKLF